MNAVEFLKQKKRMCGKYKADGCKRCPLRPAPAYGDYEYVSCGQFMDKDPEKVTYIVSEWSLANPILTNAMKFEQVFGSVKPIAKLLNESPYYWNMEYDEPVT